MHILKLHQKSTWKQRGIFNQQNYTDKSTLRKLGFFEHRNYIEKVRGNDEESRQNLVFDILK